MSLSDLCLYYSDFHMNELYYNLDPQLVALYHKYDDISYLMNFLMPEEWDYVWELYDFYEITKKDKFVLLKNMIIAVLKLRNQNRNITRSETQKLPEVKTETQKPIEEKSEEKSYLSDLGLARLNHFNEVTAAFDKTPEVEQSLEEQVVTASFKTPKVDQPSIEEKVVTVSFSFSDKGLLILDRICDITSSINETSESKQIESAILTLDNMIDVLDRMDKTIMDSQEKKQLINRINMKLERLEKHLTRIAVKPEGLEKDLNQIMVIENEVSDDVSIKSEPSKEDDCLDQIIRIINSITPSSTSQDMHIALQDLSDLDKKLDLYFDDNTPEMDNLAGHINAAHDTIYKIMSIRDEIKELEKQCN